MMKWDEAFEKGNQPEFGQITKFVNNKLWEELCSFIETQFGSEPSIEYSTCSMARGWNVKYKKARKSICTLYPEKDTFYCMITIGKNEAVESEMYLPSCHQSIQKLYNDINSLNGAKWLSIEVINEEVLENIINLMKIKFKVK